MARVSPAVDEVDGLVEVVASHAQQGVQHVLGVGGVAGPRFFEA